jgi:hypothetical protein
MNNGIDIVQSQDPILAPADISAHHLDLRLPEQLA